MSLADTLERVVGDLEVAELEGEIATEIECDASACHNRAAWSTRCETCADVVLWCMPCKRAAEEGVAQWIIARRPFRVVCRECGERFPLPLPFLPL